MNIKDFVNKTNVCNFEYYRKNILYYSVKNTTNDINYIFPVPIEDIGDATFNHNERSIYMMRYIRKALDENTLSQYIS